MSSEMVERIARAIYEGRNGRGCTPWARLAGAHKNPYLSDAIAALKAEHEPSLWAQIAGRDAMLSEDPDLDLSTDDARACWAAMIDHEIKLAEGGQDE